MTHALSCGAWPGRRGSPEDGGNRSSRVGGGPDMERNTRQTLCGRVCADASVRSGQPRTHSRECGIQPAHQSLITNVRLILPPAMRRQSAVLNPTFAAPDDRQVLLQEQKVSVELITATQDNGHRDATMVLAACRHGRGAGRLQNGYPARPEGQATHIWRPSNSLRRIARPTRRRCRQDYLKHGTSSGVRYTERSLTRF